MWQAAHRRPNFGGAALIATLHKGLHPNKGRQKEKKMR